MKVVIFCGGQGTRIRGVDDTSPKPMLMIGNRPIIWHIMKIYSQYGLNDFILLLGYKGEVIRNYFLNYAALSASVTVDLSTPWPHALKVHKKVTEPWRVTLVDTGENSMTGARLWRAQEYLKGETSFCATYGDGVGNVNISELIRFHKSHGKVATVTGVNAPGRFGELGIDGTTVKTFNEKPQVSGGFISGGFFVFDQSIFRQFLNAREDLVLEKQPMERLASGGDLKVFRHEGFWQPMDTPRDYQLLNQLYQAGNPPWLPVSLSEKKDEAA